jgi:hypothetical protein
MHILEECAFWEDLFGHFEDFLFDLFLEVFPDGDYQYDDGGGGKCVVELHDRFVHHVLHLHLFIPVLQRETAHQEEVKGTGAQRSQRNQGFHVGGAELDVVV